MPSEAASSVMAVNDPTELYNLLLQYHPLKNLVPILNEIVPKVICDLDGKVCPI